MLAPSFSISAEATSSHRFPTLLIGASAPRSLAVAGAIFVDGRPAAGAVVSLHPVGPLRFAYQTPRTLVAADGSFVLNELDSHGVAEGDYALTCEWRGGSSPASGDNRLPVRFARPDATPVRVRLARQPVRLPIIHINCDG